MPQSSPIYGDKDPRELPAYTLSTAAYLLKLPSTTLQKWVAGRPSRAAYNAQPVPPLILLPEGSTSLSFNNLLEAHTLSSLRRRHQISPANVRKAIDTLRAIYPKSNHPLLELDFQTDGVSLFVEDLSSLINLSKGGQRAIRELFDVHLQRVERDDTGLPVKLFPFVRNPDASVEELKAEPRPVEINPRVSFGKPVLTGTGIPTISIAERFQAGENPLDIADYYERDVSEILEAIRYETHLRAA